MRLIFLYLFPLTLLAQYGQSPYNRYADQGLVVAQDNDCWRPVVAQGEIIKFDYAINYYLDGDTFDFPLRKVWKTSGGEKIWNTKTESLDDQIITVNDGIYRSIIYPDTLYFERYFKEQSVTVRYRLSLFADDIYLVYQIRPLFYNFEGKTINFDSYDYLGIYQGWPDYFMVRNSYRTDPDVVLRQIEKNRCKDRDAGRRRAGAQ